MIRKAFGSSPLAAASDDIERPARAAMRGEGVARDHGVRALDDAARRACAGGGRHEPGLLERGVALDGASGP